MSWRKQLSLVLEIVERHQILDIEGIFIGEDDDIGFFWDGIDDTIVVIRYFQRLSYFDFSFEVIVLLDGADRRTEGTCDLEERISFLDKILDDSIVFIIYIDGDSIDIDFMGDSSVSFYEARIYSELIFVLGEPIGIDDDEDEEYYKKK